MKPAAANSSKLSGDQPARSVHTAVMSNRGAFAQLPIGPSGMNPLNEAFSSPLPPRGRCTPPSCPGMRHKRGKQSAAHSHLNHSKRENSRGKAHGSAAESFSSLLERARIGVFHYMR